MRPPKQPIIIALDGYSSCGKSTFAKAIAKELGYLFIDSGAMYRAVTLFAMENGFIKDHQLDTAKLKQSMPAVQVDFKFNPASSRHETHLNGRNVEEQIRSMEVSENVSEVSKIKEVRSRLVTLQQKIGESKGIVMDGRDIGTVVFPNAEIKIFMTARPEVRAQRRYKELQEKGQSITLEEVSQNLTQRDYIDENRENSPLRKADDALVLDNSNMTPQQQMIWFEDILKKFTL